MSNCEANKNTAKKNARACNGNGNGNGNGNKQKMMYMNGAILLEIMRRLNKPATALEITRAVADFFEVPAITIKGIVIEHVAVSTRMGFLVKTDPRHYALPNIDLNDKKREINNSLATSIAKLPKTCDLEKCDVDEKKCDDPFSFKKIKVLPSKKYLSSLRRVRRDMKCKYDKPKLKCISDKPKRESSDTC